MGQCRGLQRLHQLPGGDAIGQWQLAAREHQHVAHLMLQLVQAFLETSGETLLGLDRQRLLSQMAGVEQRSGQGSTNLMGQRGNHAPQGRQALMPSQLIL
ncbi:hypothetical protein D3C87_1806970 [compost metagenome]